MPGNGASAWPSTLPFGAGHEACRVLLQRMAERIVGRDEEPGVGAFLHRGIDDAVRHRPGVVDPMQMVRAAMRAGDVGRGAAGEDRHLVLLLRQIADGESGGGQRHVGDDIDALVVVPIGRDRERDVGLELKIGLDDLGLDAWMGLHEVLDGHLRAEHRTGAGVGGIDADHVGEHADAYRLVRGAGAAGECSRGTGGKAAPRIARRPIVDFMCRFAPLRCCAQL